MLASWVEVTGCGTRYEDLTADVQVHVDYAPPIGEPWLQGKDDPDSNPTGFGPVISPFQGPFSPSRPYSGTSPRRRDK